MYDKQPNEKTLRLRYIRVLEKFITRSIAILKKDTLDIDLYKKAILKNYEEMNKTKAINLYSEYPVALKGLAQSILDTLENHSKDFEEEKAYILKQANLLDKLKNNNRYKKDKHKNKKYNDGY